MKKEKDIKVALIRVEEDAAPLIEVGYVDKEARELTGVMLLDSGSNNNFLVGGMADSIGELCKLEKVTDDIETSTGDCISAKNVHFSFAVDGCQYSETFCIADINLPTLIGRAPVIGILGNIFMQKHGLVIDYTDFTLHTTHIDEQNLTVGDCDFFFPMEIGLKNYGIPGLSMAQNNLEVIAFADTGASSNMFSAKALNDDGFHCKYLGTTDVMNGVTGSIEVKDAIMDFCLVSVKEDSTEDLPRRDYFKVSPINAIDPKEGSLDENGQPLEPVEAVIGASFMAREGWILDFGAKVIYKPKHNYKWHDNISVRLGVEKDNSEKERETGRIPFFGDASEMGMPYIRISEGQLKGIIMMVDTGSNSNILFGAAYNQLKDEFETVEGDASIFGMDGKPVEADTVSGTMSFCGKPHKLTFLVRKENDAFESLYQNIGLPISGIIGTNFMVEHNWIIDFGKQEIVIPKEDFSLSDLQTKSNNQKVCTTV